MTNINTFDKTAAINTLCDLIEEDEKKFNLLLSEKQNPYNKLAAIDSIIKSKRVKNNEAQKSANQYLSTSFLLGRTINNKTADEFGQSLDPKDFLLVKYFIDFFEKQENIGMIPAESLIPLETAVLHITNAFRYESFKESTKQAYNNKDDLETFTFKNLEHNQKLRTLIAELYMDIIKRTNDPVKTDEPKTRRVDMKLAAELFIDTFTNKSIARLIPFLKDKEEAKILRLADTYAEYIRPDIYKQDMLHFLLEPQTILPMLNETENVQETLQIIDLLEKEREKSMKKDLDKLSEIKRSYDLIFDKNQRIPNLDKYEIAIEMQDKLEEMRIKFFQSKHNEAFSFTNMCSKVIQVKAVEYTSRIEFTTKTLDDAKKEIITNKPKIKMIFSTDHTNHQDYTSKDAIYLESVLQLTTKTKEFIRQLESDRAIDDKKRETEELNNDLAVILESKSAEYSLYCNELVNSINNLLAERKWKTKPEITILEQKLPQAIDSATGHKALYPEKENKLETIVTTIRELISNYNTELKTNMNELKNLLDKGTKLMKKTGRKISIEPTKNYCTELAQIITTANESIELLNKYSNDPAYQTMTESCRNTYNRIIKKCNPQRRNAHIRIITEIEELLKNTGFIDSNCSQNTDILDKYESQTKDIHDRLEILGHTESEKIESIRNKITEKKTEIKKILNEKQNIVEEAYSSLRKDREKLNEIITAKFSPEKSTTLTEILKTITQIRQMIPAEWSNEQELSKTITYIDISYTKSIELLKNEAEMMIKQLNQSYEEMTKQINTQGQKDTYSLNVALNAKKLIEKTRPTYDNLANILRVTA